MTARLRPTKPDLKICRFSFDLYVTIWLPTTQAKSSELGYEMGADTFNSNRVLENTKQFNPKLFNAFFCYLGYCNRVLPVG
jgi:hypothetical protein